MQVEKLLLFNKIENFEPKNFECFYLMKSTTAQRKKYLWSFESHREIILNQVKEITQNIKIRAMRDGASEVLSKKKITHFYFFVCFPQTDNVYLNYRLIESPLRSFYFLFGLMIHVRRKPIFK